jgi:hypothetical protein
MVDKARRIPLKPITRSLTADMQIPVAISRKNDAIVKEYFVNGAGSARTALKIRLAFLSSSL